MNETRDKRALIVLDGDLDSALPYVDTDSYDYILAVDGALDRLLALGLRPDAVTGDFDGVTPVGLETARGLGITVDHQPEQESTDFTKALRHLAERSIYRVDVTGYRGSRLDQVLAVLSDAAAHADRFTLRLIDETADGFVLAGPGSLPIEGRSGHVCSVMPIRSCSRVTLTGFRWPLDDATLRLGERTSSSNEIAGDRAEVRFASGILLIYLHREKRAAKR